MDYSGGETMKSGEESLFLTAKGAGELHAHTSKLDVTAKNILSLIDEGCTTTATILQRSMFAHNAVMEGLRRLLSNGLVAIATDGGAASTRKPGAATSGARAAGQDLRLEFGVSVSHGRFVLSDFCLDEFGAAGQEMVAVVALCTDVMSLQEALNDIRAEVEQRCPDRLPVLLERVRDINETAS
jgi:hypothetical protein